MTKPPAMPELPEPDYWSTRDDDTPLYTADQMRAYALAALQPQPAADWRDRLTVNLMRQGAGLTKTQIRALIAYAHDGIEPDPALFEQPAAAVSDADIWRLWDSQDRPELTGGPCPVKFARAILALRPQAVPMTPEQMHDAYKQSPDSKNCMQCAAAYMLGLPMSAVPDFEKAGADAWESFEAFFADRGFTAEMFPPSVEIVGDYLASGDTARGTSHMVVMRGGELLHDPHPSNAGLKSVQAVWLITRRAGCRDGITQRADGGEKQA